ncbi:MAG TPA: hypothetical protein VFH29_06295, partial [Anaerolineales bacterium]|nr:hypothetical protein [Anaerolineales bacterium]
MMRSKAKSLLGLALLVGFAGGCVAPPTAETQISPLTVSIRYPLPDTTFQMGRTLKAIIEVRDAAGAKVADAKVTLVVSDQTGKQVASVQAPAGTDGIYRSEPVPIPHRTAP